MATVKYIFTVSNGQLLVKLNNVALEFEGDNYQTYKSPTLVLFKNNIKLSDFGIFINSFKIENFDTINGVVPADIEDAFALLLALLPTAGGGGGAGDASSANQDLGNASLNNLDIKSSALFVSSTGTLTGASQTVSLAITDESAGSVQITGTWVGTITFEGTLDGTTFFPIDAVSSATSSPQSTTTVNGLYRLTPASFLSFRVNMSVFTSGSAVISMRATKGSGGIFANQTLPTKNDNSDVILSAINTKLPNQVNNTQPTSLSGINFAFSTVNSSVAQLASLATFTGTIEDTKNQPSISLLMVSDQNMLVTVLQYIDLAGTKLVSSTPFTVYAGNQLAKSFPINGNYVKVTAQNIGASTTTTFQLDTAYGIIDTSDGSSNIPVSQSQQFASGNITTQNLVANGVATANSAVEILLNGASNLSIQTTGTYTGALSLQVTNNNLRWETVTGALIYNSITGLYSATITSASIGIFSFKTGAFYKARVTGLSAMTGTCTVTLRANNSSSISTLDSAIPVGTNSIGNIGTVATVSAVTGVTNAGTPTVPATAFFLNSAATTNGALIITGTSGLSAFYATNIGATVAFVKLYNKATAPTVGSDSPEMTIPIPPAVAGVAGVANISMGFNAFRFPLGLGIAITGVYADTDTTAVALNQVKVKISRTI